MREIKFRAWFNPKSHDALERGMYQVSKISNKALIGGEWSDIKEVGLFEPRLGKGGNGFELTVADTEVELMQFTGLIDKNGKEIYEGDMVKASSEGAWRIVEVRWREVGNPQWILYPAYHDGVFWYLNGASKNSDGKYQETCEIVGNIYENPELKSL